MLTNKTTFYTFCLVFPLFFLAGASHLSAQAIKVTQVEYKWGANHLPGFPVFSLCETSDGFVWLGMQALGVGRYDGAEIKFFGPEVGIHGSVNHLVEDKRGHLWVGCRANRGYGNGLTVSDHSVTGGVIQVDIKFRDELDSQQLATGEVIGLTMDTHGQIWAMTDSLIQINRWEGDTSLRVFNLDGVGQGRSSVRALSLEANDSGNVWVSYDDGWLFRYELAPGSEHPLALDSIHVPSLDGAGDVSTMRIGTIREDGTLAGTDGAGNNYLLLKTASESLLVQPFDYPVTSIQAFNDDKLMALTQGNGLYIVDQETGRKEKHYSTDEGLPTSILYSALVSVQGDLWVSGYNGVFHMPADFEAIATYTNDAHGDRPPLLSEPSVNNVSSDVWLLNAAGGYDTCVVAGTLNGLLVVPQASPPYTVTPEDGLPVDIVIGQVQDKRGGIYISSIREEGIYYIHPQGKRHPSAIETTDLSAFSAGYQIDRLDFGRFFLPFLLELPGMGEQSLWAAQGKRIRSQVWGELPLDFVSDAGFDSQGFANLIMDDRGHLHALNTQGWYRSLQPITAELYRSLAVPDNLAEDGKHYEINTPFFEKVSITDQQGKVLEKNIMSSLYAEGRLWIGSIGKLFVVNPEKGEVERSFSMEDSTHFISALTNDEDLIWLGSNAGLIGLNKTDLSVAYNLQQHDGLLSSSNWSPFGLKISNRRRIYQGTSQGLHAIDPAKDSPDTFPRPTYLTDYTYTEDIWGRNELNVAYAMLSYRDRPGNIRYQTMLNGYDDEWSEITFETELRYTNLTAFLFPKTYYMEVSGMDYRGDVFVSTPEAYPVVVNPPVYFRWWAVLGYLAILALTVRTYTRYQLRQQEKDLRLREADTIRQQRDEIAAKNAENETLLKEIHHRVKNNLEVVSSLLELQSATLEEGGARDAMLAGQSRVASMGLLHQRLYQGRNLAAVNMREYLKELTESLGETYDTSDNVSFIVTVPADLELDVDTAVPVGLIINELVTNSLKYAFENMGAAAGAVEVKMSRAGEQTVLSVSDNGVGKVEGTAQGTGFGTKLVKLLTRQLDGVLQEENNDGLCTRVTFGK